MFSGVMGKELLLFGYWQMVLWLVWLKLGDMIENRHSCLVLGVSRKGLLFQLAKI